MENWNRRPSGMSLAIALILGAGLLVALLLPVTAFAGSKYHGSRGSFRLEIRSAPPAIVHGYGAAYVPVAPYGSTYGYGPYYYVPPYRSYYDGRYAPYYRDYYVPRYRDYYYAPRYREYYRSGPSIDLKYKYRDHDRYRHYRHYDRDRWKDRDWDHGDRSRHRDYRRDKHRGHDHD